MKLSQNSIIYTLYHVTFHPFWPFGEITSETGKLTFKLFHWSILKLLQTKY